MHLIYYSYDNWQGCVLIFSGNEALLGYTYHLPLPRHIAWVLRVVELGPQCRCDCSKCGRTADVGKNVNEGKNKAM